MKTAVIGRSAMAIALRASLLTCFLSGLLSLGCATPPKPRELDALEKLRADPAMPAARKKGARSVQESRQVLRGGHREVAEQRSQRVGHHALLGQIFFRHALALADQDKSNARIGDAEDALAATAEELAKTQKDLEDENEKIGLLSKAAHQNEEMKALTAQMAADKKANEDKLSQEKLRADTGDRISDAELAIKTAETVNAAKYAPELYKSAAQILAKAQMEFQAGQMDQAQSSAGIAKKTADDAAAAAKPSYARDSQAEENRKKADGLFAEASRIPE